MTEEKALTKWCPHVRQPIENDEWSGGFNRGNAGDPANLNVIDNQCNCIASDCAMWVSDGLEQIDGADYEIGHCGLIK